MLTIWEIQSRLETAILALSHSNSPQQVPEEIQLLARSFKQRSRITQAIVQPVELVLALLNVMVMASELGVNLEGKIEELLAQIEHPSFCSS